MPFTPLLSPLLEVCPIFAEEATEKFVRASLPGDERAECAEWQRFLRSDVPSLDRWLDLNA